jgi:ATP-dependent DNA ligase
MTLPLPLDYAPMEANTAREIPVGSEWEYEPKWDGFRCLAFRDGGDLAIMSKAGQPLARYFPEIHAALLALAAQKFVLDGELIVTEERTLNFDALLQRIHPAESRIRKLAAETPATLLVFDLLVDDHAADLTGRILDDRRAALERFAKTYFTGHQRIRLSPRTRDFETARRWFKRMAGPLDGVIAKRVDRPYASGERKSMIVWSAASATARKSALSAPSCSASMTSRAC